MHPCNKAFDNTAGQWLCTRDEGHQGPCAAVPRVKYDQLPQLPIAMRIPCEDCGQLHIDEGEFATKPHHTHACQYCGHVWRPAVVYTVGVRFLPGFKNA